MKIQYFQDTDTLYGDDNSEKIKTFVQDLEKVSRAFQRMAVCYMSRRVEKGAWSEFIADLQANSLLSLGPKYLEMRK